MILYRCSFFISNLIRFRSFEMYMYVLCIVDIIGFLKQGKVSFYLCRAQLVKDAQLEADTVH